MKLLKNAFIIGLVTSAVVSSVFAASVTTTIQSGGLSNLVLRTGLPVKVTQIVVTSQATNSARVKIYDCPTNSVTYTNAAYTNVLSYLTNYITLYTNYFGVTNAFTNYAMVDVSQQVAATTNTYPVRVEAIAPTNTSAVYDGVNYYFYSGIWATNNSAGAATVTVTYQ